MVVQKRTRQEHARAARLDLFSMPSATSVHYCITCGSDRACFGFGPPLIPKLIWVCRAHRADVDPACLPEWLR
jgi:hypothetical protein